LVKLPVVILPLCVIILVTPLGITNDDNKVHPLKAFQSIFNTLPDAHPILNEVKLLQFKHAFASILYKLYIYICVNCVQFANAFVDILIGGLEEINIFLILDDEKSLPNTFDPYPPYAKVTVLHFGKLFLNHANCVDPIPLTFSSQIFKLVHALNDEVMFVIVEDGLFIVIVVG
jgi:hypothetical protein